MKSRFKLYHIDMKYINKLHKIDDHVPSVSPQINKQTRPFLGIVVMVNESKYCIPLTSCSDEKSKRIELLRDNLTLRKIYDKDGKVLAALNLNNMVPVREENIREIELRILPTDSAKLRRWKKLCIKELDWCQSHQDEIERLANELHRKYNSKEPFGKRRICVNFPALEEQCNK